MAKFQPGHSGNPAGRPKGTRSRFTKYRKLVEAAMPEILAALIKQAKSGDTTAARVLLNRMWPEVSHEIEDMESLIAELSARVEEMQMRKVA